MRSIKLITLLSIIITALLISPAQTQTQTPGPVYLPLVRGGNVPPVPVASYLGGSGAAAVRGVAFANDGTPLLAGRWPDDLIGGILANPLPGGEGAVVRLSFDGRTVVAAARVGANVVDLEASAAGPVIACGPFGIIALPPELDRVHWRATPGDMRRCATDANGAAAALVGNRVYLYQANGTAEANWLVPGTSVADLALDATTGLVFVTGYSQKTSALKVAYLRAYSRSGNLRWTAYDFTATAIDAARLTADSEGRRVSMGADGRLYLGAWTDGGNSILGRDPLDMNRTPLATELIKFDGYNNPFNLSGAKSLAWYGRFDPATGRLLLGQWLLTRLDNGTGNSIGIEAVSADATGRLLITGGSFAHMAGRTGMRFLDQTLGNYEGNETYLLVVSPDFRSRQLWTALAAPGTAAGNSPGTGVAVFEGRLLLGATLTPRTTTPPRGLVVTPNALQPAPANPTTNAGYYLLMGLP
ncbi:MAG: hypothetical protein AB4911_05485 [Oscillochloridaceae bacterium umkhey_bin13]